MTDLLIIAYFSANIAMCAFYYFFHYWRGTREDRLTCAILLLAGIPAFIYSIYITPKGSQK